MAGALLARIPTRVRVAAAFTGVMAVLLAALGLSLYVLLGSALQATVERGLRSRAADVGALARQGETRLAGTESSPLTEQDESFAQVIDLRGGVVDASPSLRGGRCSRPRRCGARRGAPCWSRTTHRRSTTTGCGCWPRRCARATSA